MSNKKQTPGAFGGLYRHEVIRQLRAQLAQSNLIIAALVDHTKISEKDLKQIVSEFFTRKQHEMSNHKII